MNRTESKELGQWGKTGQPLVALLRSYLGTAFVRDCYHSMLANISETKHSIFKVIQKTRNN